MNVNKIFDFEYFSSLTLQEQFNIMKTILGESVLMNKFDLYDDVPVARTDDSDWNWKVKEKKEEMKKEREYVFDGLSGGEDAPSTRESKALKPIAKGPEYSNKKYEVSFNVDGVMSEKKLREEIDPFLRRMEQDGARTDRNVRVVRERKEVREEDDEVCDANYGAQITEKPVDESDPRWRVFTK